MKKIMLSILVGSFAVCGFAQSSDAPKTDAKKDVKAAGSKMNTKATEKTTIKCAVMPGDEEINIKDATAKKMFADYKGNRYYFCCTACKPAFAKNPAKYAKGAHVKTPVTEKPKAKAAK